MNFSPILLVSFASTILLCSHSRELIELRASRSVLLVPRAVYHPSCDAHHRQLVNEVISLVRVLTQLGIDASNGNNNDPFDRAAFFNHFRRDTDREHAFVHQTFRRIYADADHTLRPQLYAGRGHDFRPVEIQCTRRENRCLTRPAYLSWEGTKIVIVGAPLLRLIPDSIV